MKPELSNSNIHPLTPVIIPRVSIARAHANIAENVVEIHIHVQGHSHGADTIRTDTVESHVIRARRLLLGLRLVIHHVLTPKAQALPHEILIGKGDEVGALDHFIAGRSRRMRCRRLHLRLQIQMLKLRRQRRRNSDFAGETLETWESIDSGRGGPKGGITRCR